MYGPFGQMRLDVWTIWTNEIRCMDLWTIIINLCIIIIFFKLTLAGIKLTSRSTI